MSKLSLGIVFGGVSSEHDVSCVSAFGVLSNLDKEKYDIHPIGITKDGKWYAYFGEYANLPDDKWLKGEIAPAVISPDRDDHGMIVFKDGGAERIRLDVVFPVMHGLNGEDGTIQGLFELAGIPYVGCGVTCSGMTMDKYMTKLVVNTLGINQAKCEVVYPNMLNNDAAIYAAADRIGYPIFVKPACAGSSVGVSKVKTREELLPAIKLAATTPGKILLEESITGYDVEVSVLGNGDPIASCVGKIVPTQEFYTYDAKYADESSRLIIPADILPQDAALIREFAVRIFTALECSGLSRVDFFHDPVTGRVVFNEINTIPGFTPISMYPQLLAESGIPYGELLDRLVALAIERATH